ncbi:MAG TPA: hypothetical protein VJ385_21050 [Fibrobacteria bacterium]|nr:hypothetical protein [Fibrobacteria bacterium]
MFRFKTAFAFACSLAPAGLGFAQSEQDPYDYINTVHPAWSVSALRPNAWEVQVGGMDFLPNGKLIVLEHKDPNEQHSGVPTAKGKLWLIDNPTATGEAIQYRQLAASLKEPVGMMVLNGKLIVAEKWELTEWTLNEGLTAATKTRTIAAIPHDKDGNVNFQEYVFGVLYKDGYFYVAVGGAVASGGLSFVNDQGKMDNDRTGSLLKIKESDGTITMLSGGMRACNGIAWGPEGSIWMTDNQGSYRPSSEITAMVEGGYYGYPNKQNPAFAGKPVTPPSIWSVYGEIGYSPTYPHLMKKGVYAGQFLIGDLAKGGIKRTFMEKVNGDWQGAIFSFTGGLEVGIETILEDSAGVLYAGGMGRGDPRNWGWNTKKFGLQKLTPKPGITTFEILAIRSRRNGMEIEFTKPTGAGAEAASSYKVTSAQMDLSKPGYGEGNMIGKTTLSIKTVTVSPDRRKVFLELNGMAANRVLTLKTDGVKSEGGESVRCGAGWYTLNSISQSEAFSPATNLAQKDPALADAHSILVRREAGGLRVSVPFEGGHSLVLSDLQGRKVTARSGSGAREYVFATGAWPPGVYLLQARAGGRTFARMISF